MIIAFWSSDLHLTEIAHPAEADPTCHQHEEKDPRIDNIANANKFPGESSGWRDSDSQLHHSHNNAPGNSDFHLLHGPEKEPQFFDTVDENVQSDHQADKDAILHSIKCYRAGDQLSDQDCEPTSQKCTWITHCKNIDAESASHFYV
jgi:hypothetical protein